MALSPGTRLGHYAVTSLLGEGGMGQVWQATDTQLNRQVALKILPDAFAADPDRLARFQREAQILASLNHPNIAAIYGIEEAGGTRALVLELVEGPTLADRIATGPIPLDEALPIAKQIAEALEAAHEQGVIHRDLKPANIKVKDDGTVKVLDFGLAKTVAGEGFTLDPSNGPTVATVAVTEVGVIQGTPAYMNPQQVRGELVNQCTDVWAFGRVLYEMLAGKQVFGGTTFADAAAAIIGREPDWGALPEDSGPYRELLQRCLQKDIGRRLPHIGDVRRAIDEGLTSPKLTVAEPRARPVTHVIKLLEEVDRRKRRLQHFAVAVGALLIVIGVASLETTSLGVSAVPVILGAVAIVVGARIKQRFEVEYKGHRIRYENGPLTGERLFLDEGLVAKATVGYRIELRARINVGDGAGDEIMVLSEAGLFSFRCRIFIEQETVT